MFFAAFAYRSWVRPHLAHSHFRTDKGIDVAVNPHAEHTFVDGTQLLTTIGGRSHQ
jgi:hypothetical protein